MYNMIINNVINNAINHDINDNTVTNTVVANIGGRRYWMEEDAKLIKKMLENHPELDPQ